MRVWIDLANSPHVALFRPVEAELRARGHQVLLTCRDHAQTLELARGAWPGVVVAGGPSPPGVVRKGWAVASRACNRVRFARRTRPDVALSHGSYAQVAAGRLVGARVVTMMDYEHQPANHVSFRVAHTVVVPQVFPGRELRRAGARERKVVRYDGFKEELYLSGVEPDREGLARLGVDPAAVVAAMRPPPEGALYHRGRKGRFEEVLDHVLAAGAQVLLFPRDGAQAARYARPGVHVPERVADGPAVLASVDLTVGAGGTMTRESALLGTPTYTVFAGELAAVDGELIRQGRVVDLRNGGLPAVESRPAGAAGVDPSRSRVVLEAVLAAVVRG